MSRFHLRKLRFLSPAAIAGLRTSGMEPAAGRRVRRAWNLSFQVDPLSLIFLVYLRDRRKQRLRIRVIMLFIQLVVTGDLHHLPQIHDAYPVAHLIDYVQVVGNKEIRQSQLLLQLL